MPITEQLQTSEQLQQAGLPRAAAVLIAEKIEAAAQATHESALDRFRTELRAELGALRADLEKSIRTSQTVILASMGPVVAVVDGFGTAILTVLLKR